MHVEFSIMPHGRLIWMALAAWLILFSGTVGAAEERFDVLQIGTQDVHKCDSDHQGEELHLHPACRRHDQYQDRRAAPRATGRARLCCRWRSKGATNTAAAWAKREMAKISVPQVKELGKQLEQKWRGNSAAGLSAMGLGGSDADSRRLGNRPADLSVLLLLLHVDLPEDRQSAGRPGLAAGAAALSVAPCRRHVGLVVPGILRAGG